MTHRARIAFLGWQLGPYGGLETRIAAALDIASRAGYATHVQLARPLVPGSPTEEALRDHHVYSVTGDWMSRPAVRIAQQMGRVVTGLRDRRLVDRQEARQLGHRWLMSEIGRYWDGAGRQLLVDTDLLHLFGPPLPFVVDALRAAHEERIPVLYQAVHSVTSQYADHPLRRGFVDTCNLLDMILTTYDGQAADFRDHFHYRGPALSLGQSAYENEDSLVAIDRQVPNEGPVTIGTLCRLDPVKGVDMLIEAFAALPEELPVRLRIGGDGPENVALRQLADSLGMQDRVEFAGRVDDRITFYRSIDIFALTSHAEGGPVTGVEAMAAGLPVVSTRVGAMPERLEGARGLLIDVGDRTALVEALRDLATSFGLRLELGNQARQAYEERYTSAVQARRLVDTWEGLIARRR